MKKKGILFEGATCPLCEHGALKLKKETMSFDYKNYPIVMDKNMLACEVCKVSFFLPEEEGKMDRLLTSERQKADGLLTANEIKDR